MAIVEARVPAGNADPADRAQFLEGLENLGSEGVVLAPQGDDGKASYGIELKEALANTWQAFQAFKASIQTDFAVLMLGQNLTTEAKGGGLGGGEAATHDQVRGDIVAFDAEIGPDIQTQVFGPWTENNYGDRALTPTFEFQTEAPADAKVVGDGQMAGAQAALAWQAAGVDVNAEQMAIDAGAPMLTPEEAAAKRAEREEEAAEREAEAAAEAAAQGGAPGSAIEPADEPPAEDATAANLRAPMDFVRDRYTFQGFQIAVENKAGTLRFWKSDDGVTLGQTEMLHDYGFVEGYLGEDNEELDVYIGPDPEATEVHVVHQLKAPDFKKPDEDKIFLGFPDAVAAKAAFLAHRNDAGAYGGMTTFTLEGHRGFRARLSRRKPEATTRMRATAPRVGVAKLRAVPRAGGKAVATYIDQLDAAAQKRGAESIRPSLDAILAAVRDGTSWDDIKTRALKHLKTADGKAIAETMARARIMAHLSGRAGVLERI